MADHTQGVLSSCIKPTGLEVSFTDYVPRQLDTVSLILIGLSVVAVLIMVWAMQRTTLHANFSSWRGRWLWLQRTVMGSSAIGLALNVLLIVSAETPVWAFSLPPLVSLSMSTLFLGIHYDFTFEKT